MAGGRHQPLPTPWLRSYYFFRFPLQPSDCGPPIFENMLYFSTLPWYLRVWESRCWDNIRLIFKHLYTGYPGETAHTEPKEVDRRKLLIFYLSVGWVWFSSLLVPSHQKSELLVPSTPLSASEIRRSIFYILVCLYRDIIQIFMYFMSGAWDSSSLCVS